MILTTPSWVEKLQGGVTRKIECLFQEPDAGNLAVRFDEREPHYSFSSLSSGASVGLENSIR